MIIHIIKAKDHIYQSYIVEYSFLSETNLCARYMLEYPTHSFITKILFWINREFYSIFLAAFLADASKGSFKELSSYRCNMHNFPVDKVK
jgi:hypothetical protein